MRYQFGQKFQLLAGVAAAIMMSACASTSAPAGPLNPAVAASNPPTPPVNDNINILSAGNPQNFLAVDETFEVAAGFLTVRVNGANGLDLISASRTDFRDPGGTATYDASSRTLTFDIQQGAIDINDVFGPLLLSAPADFANLVNDTLAVTISSLPESFPNVPGNIVLPNGATSFEQLRNDPGSVDFFIQDLQRILNGEPSQLGTTADSDAITAFLGSLNDTTTRIFSFDFIRHESVNGTGNTFQPFKIRGNNPGITPSYVVLGVWDTRPVDATVNDFTVGVSAFGVPTPANEVPNAGSASYNTTIAGYVLRQAGLTFLTGSVNLTANFDSRLVNYDVQTILATSDVDGQTLFTPFVDLEGQGLLSGGARFNGTLIGVDDISLRGSVDGAFFGPGAVEVGGTLDFSNDELRATGGFVGTRIEGN